MKNMVLKGAMAHTSTPPDDNDLEYVNAESAPIGDLQHPQGGDNSFNERTVADVLRQNGITPVEATYRVRWKLLGQDKMYIIDQTGRPIGTVYIDATGEKIYFDQAEGDESYEMTGEDVIFFDGSERNQMFQGTSQHILDRPNLHISSECSKDKKGFHVDFKNISRTHRFGLKLG